MPSYGVRRPNYLGWAKLARAPRIVASFDALDPSHYTLGTGTNIATATSQNGRRVIGSQGNTALRPDVASAAINSRDVFSFADGGGEFIAVSDLLTAFSGVPGIFRRGPVQIAALPSVIYALDVIFSSSGNGRFFVAIIPDGSIRVQLRRFPGDTIKTIDSALKVSTGVVHDIAVSADFTTGNVIIRLDQDVELRSTGVFTSGFGPTERAPSSALPQFGRSGTAFFAGLMGRVDWGVGIATRDYLEALRVADQPVFNTPQRSLAVNSKPVTLRNKIYRSSSGVAAVPVSGTVTVGADADIYMRLLDSTTRTPASGWSTPQFLVTSSGRVWSGTPSVPDGSWFGEYRKNGERDADAVVDTSNIIGVSDSITGFDGQSITRNFATEIGGPYPQAVIPAVGDDLKDRRHSVGGFGFYYLNQTVNSTANVPVGTGEPQTLQMVSTVSGSGGSGGGNGTKKFGTLMRALDGGAPALVVPVSVGGQVLANLLSGGSGWTNTLTVLNAADGPGYKFTRWVLGIGQSDMLAGTSYATYYAQLVAYFAQVRGVMTAGNALYCYVGPPGWLSAGAPTVPNAQAIHQATWDLLDTFGSTATDGTGRIFLGWMDHDRPRSDGTHLLPSNNEHVACRLVQNIAYREKAASHGARGPKLTSVSGVAGNSYIEGTFTLDGGTTLKGLIYNPADPMALTPSYQTTGLTGSLMKINATPTTPASVAITAAMKVRWGTPSPLVSGNTFDIGLYITPDFDQSVMLMDDSNPQGDTIGSPAQPTRLWMSGVVA